MRRGDHLLEARRVEAPAGQLLEGRDQLAVLGGQRLDLRLADYDVLVAVVHVELLQILGVLPPRFLAPDQFLSPHVEQRLFLELLEGVPDGPGIEPGLPDNILVRENSAMVQDPEVMVVGTFSGAGLSDSSGIARWSRRSARTGARTSSATTRGR